MINNKAASLKTLTYFKWGTSAKEMEESFLNNKAFVWCGDAAHYLMQKYSALGIESYILHVGIHKSGLENNKQQWFTHALVLVALDDKNSKKYILQDSYLNWGSREDYFSILDKLKNNNLHKINFKINKNNYKKVAINYDIMPTAIEIYNIDTKTCEKLKLNNLIYVCVINDTLNIFLKRYTQGNQKIQDTLSYGYNNLQRTNNNSPFDLLTLPYAIAGQNGYIDLKIINNSQKYNKLKNLDETKLLEKILNYIK